MNQSPNSSSRFNWMQRAIQAIFGTREFAVMALVAFCAVVEVCILIATQRYEALTAPAGTVLFWGMSAAGMVIFFAEVLKLPVAWVSGVVSGKRMLVLNLVTAGLCMLTAMTIKDLVIWEWDAALKPAREFRDKAKAIDGEIDALERSRTELTQNSKEANALRQTKIDGLKKLLDDQVRRRNEDQATFNERLKSINGEVLDPATRNQIAALERTRDSSAATYKADIERLQVELSERIARQQAAVAAATAGAQQTNIKTVEQRETLRKDYEAARQQVERKRDSEIKELGEDKWFSGIKDERIRIRDEADKELKRLESEYKTNLAALGGPSIAASSTTSAAEFRDLRDQIAAKQKDRDQKVQGLEDEIRKLYQQVAKDSSAASGAYEQRVRDIEREMRGKIDTHDKKIIEYENLLSAATEENKALTLTPQQIEARLQEITTQLPVLKKNAEAFRAESDKLAKDTNPIRAANGVVRWVLPEASTERLEQVAYGVFPLSIALLVSCLPAILLEIGVYCIRPEVRVAERPRPSLLARLSRARRVLRELRARAHARVTAAEAALRECKLVREKLDLEHSSRSNNLDKEVEQKVDAAVTDLQSKTTKLVSELEQTRLREAELGVKLSEITVQLLKASEDARRLTAQVVMLDAAVHRQK